MEPGVTTDKGRISTDTDQAAHRSFASSTDGRPVPYNDEVSPCRHAALLARRADDEASCCASAERRQPWPGAPRARVLPGSRRAADDTRECREGWPQTMKDAQLEHPNRWRLSRAFTTIRHDLLVVALPRRPVGTDRGRQTANQKVTGGLVSHNRHNALYSRASAPRTFGTGRRSTSVGSERCRAIDARVLLGPPCSRGRVSETWRHPG